MKRVNLAALDRHLRDAFRLAHHTLLGRTVSILDGRAAGRTGLVTGVSLGIDGELIAMVRTDHPPRPIRIRLPLRSLVVGPRRVVDEEKRIRRQYRPDLPLATPAVILTTRMGT